MAGVTGVGLSNDRVGVALGSNSELCRKSKIQVNLDGLVGGVIFPTSGMYLQPLAFPYVCPSRIHRKECNIMNTNYRPLTRSTSNRMIAGVCAGLGEYFNIDPTLVRLLFVLAFFTGFGGIAIVYLIMAIVVPEQATTQSEQ
jgi:phage shock protein C